MFFNKGQHVRNNVIFTAGRQEHEADSCCFTGVPVIIIIIFILGGEQHPSAWGKTSLPTHRQCHPTAGSTAPLPGVIFRGQFRFRSESSTLWQRGSPGSVLYPSPFNHRLQCNPLHPSRWKWRSRETIPLQSLRAFSQRFPNSSQGAKTPPCTA